MTTSPIHAALRIWHVVSSRVVFGQLPTTLLVPDLVEPREESVWVSSPVWCLLVVITLGNQVQWGPPGFGLREALGKNVTSQLDW